jgi:hypothetical protein
MDCFLGLKVHSLYLAYVVLGSVRAKDTRWSEFCCSWMINQRRKGLGTILYSGLKTLLTGKDEAQNNSSNKMEVPFYSFMLRFVTQMSCTYKQKLLKTRLRI